MTRRTTPLNLLLFIALALPLTVMAQGTGMDMEARCEKLEDLRIQDAVILSASLVAAKDDIPEHVLVVGYTLPSNHIEIRLPTTTWNGKFLQGGCGGSCGKLWENIGGSIRIAIQRGYAISALDAGHWGETITDARWAYNNPVAEVDYAYRAVHETVRVSKIVIEAFYDRAPAYSYFWSCSNGGRQGLMEALKYPEDLDGIISEAPAINLSSFPVLYTWMAGQNTGEDGKDIIGLDAISIIARAVMDHCDAIDGQEDGLIADPRACSFDPSSLLCGNDNEGDCLSERQVEVLRSWYEGPVNSAGEPILPTGVAFGSEPFWGWFVGPTDQMGDHFFYVPDWIRYMYFDVDKGPDYDPFTEFDYDADFPATGFIRQHVDAESPELEAFNNRGGKLLMYQGWSDPSIPYDWTIKYYHSVEDRMGGKETTQDFFRLFMVPGMDHCSASSGLGMTSASVDPLTAMEKWVEEGEAPEELPVTRFDDNGEVRSQFSVYPFSE